MVKEFKYIYNERTYDVVVTYKRIKNSYFRYKDGKIYISTHYLMPLKSLVNLLDKFAPTLLKKKVVKEKPYSIDEKYIYIFGEKLILDDSLNEEKKIDKYLKDILLDYLNNRVPILKSEMDVKNNYRIRVRKMSSRHGSNSRQTMSLSFQLSLVHFSYEIIDSVIIHELAHDKVFNHSKSFYNEVYKYCPNYWTLKRKLNKGIYK